MTSPKDYLTDRVAEFRKKFDEFNIEPDDGEAEYSYYKDDEVKPL